MYYTKRADAGVCIPKYLVTLFLSVNREAKIIPGSQHIGETRMRDLNLEGESMYDIEFSEEDLH